MAVYAPFLHKLFFQLKIAPSCPDPDVLAAHAVRALLQVMKPSDNKVYTICIQLVPNTHLNFSQCPLIPKGGGGVLTLPLGRGFSAVSLTLHRAWTHGARIR